MLGHSLRITDRIKEQVGTNIGRNTVHEKSSKEITEKMEAFKKKEEIDRNALREKLQDTIQQKLVAEKAIDEIREAKEKLQKENEDLKKEAELMDRKFKVVSKIK